MAVEAQSHARPKLFLADDDVSRSFPLQHDYPCQYLEITSVGSSQIALSSHSAPPVLLRMFWTDQRAVWHISDPSHWSSVDLLLIPLMT